MRRTGLKGVNTVRKRLADGSLRTYYYHRATGAPLPGKPGDRAFALAWSDAERTVPRNSGTVSALIRSYSLSLKFERKRDSTKREYRRLMSRIEERFGTLPIKALASPRVRGVFIGYQEEIGRDHPREADNRLAMLSTVFSYAVSKGEIADNPLRGFERLHTGNRSEFIWTEKEIGAFMEAAPLELQQALILAIHTGQRYGDLIWMRWADYDGEAISLKQSKTGAPVTIRATATLKGMLDQMERRGPYILTRADGRPWFTANNDKELSKQWRKQSQALGIENLKFSDLRGTAVTLLSEAGAEVPQIAAITGHTLQSATRILEHYGKRTRALADAAILRFENAPETAFANRLQTKAISITEGKGNV